MKLALHESVTEYVLGSTVEAELQPKSKGELRLGSGFREDSHEYGKLLCEELGLTLDLRGISPDLTSSESQEPDIVLHIITQSAIHLLGRVSDAIPKNTIGQAEVDGTEVVVNINPLTAHDVKEMKRKSQEFMKNFPELAEEAAEDGAEGIEDTFTAGQWSVSSWMVKLDAETSNELQAIASACCDAVVSMMSVSLSVAPLRDAEFGDISAAFVKAFAQALLAYHLQAYR